MPVLDPGDVHDRALAPDNGSSARALDAHAGPAVAEKRQPLRVRLLQHPEDVAAHEPDPPAPHRSRRPAFIAALAILLVLGAGVGGYVSGRSGGEDIEAARRASAAAGQEKGAAQGAKEGFRRGVDSGRKRGYREAYPDAYRAAYLDEFRNAGVGAPQTVSVPQP